jgi:hypothetical protein
MLVDTTVDTNSTFLILLGSDVLELIRFTIAEEKVVE